jgi:hypothetical protein
MRLPRLAVASCSAWLASCAYHAGSFSFLGGEFAGVRVTFGCVDLGIARRADALTGPVIAYEFGNGCDWPADIDLSRVDVIARDRDGSEFALRPYDPDREIAAASLDARSHGREAIEYRLEDLTVSVAAVCVDPAPAFGGGAPRWACFGGAP